MKSPTRNKVTALKLGLSLAFMSGAACGANANEIVVSSGAERTDTADVSFLKLKISGTYTVTGQAQLKPDAGAIIELAPNEGDNAVFTLEKQARFANGKNATLKVGAGKGKITLAGGDAMVGGNWINTGARWPGIVVSSGAQAGEDGVVSLLELAGTSKYGHSVVTNENANPVEILFAGGTLVVTEWAGRQFIAKEVNPVVLRGGEGHPIRIDPNWYPSYPCGEEDNSVVTTGACDVVFAQAGRNAENYPRIRLDKTIVWGHTGDLRSEGAEITTYKDNVLPFGPQTGGVSLKSSDEQVNNGYSLTAVLDLNGTTQTVNSLDVSQNSCATNKAAKTACLKFGEGDADGTLKGVVAANVKVCKTGSGTLTLDGATVTKPDVLAGALAVAGETTVNGFGDLAGLTGLTPVLPVKDNDTNYNEQKDGSPKKVMEASGLLTVAPRTVTVNEGGALVYRNEAAEALERFVKLDAKGAFVKKGAGALFVRGSEKCPQSFSGVVRAAEGTLTLSGMGVTNAFWRVTVTGMVGKDMKEPTIGEIGLFDADGNRINLKANGYSWQKELTDATQLQGEQCMVVPTGLTYSPENGNKTPNNLFNGTYYNWMQVKSKTALASVAITFRLPANTAPARSYAFTSVGGIPSSWKVETSVDGVNWTLADERKDFYTWDWNRPGTHYYWYLDGRWGGFAGLPLTFAFANEKTDKVDLTGALLQADEGAVLDVSAVSGAVPRGIRIDVTKGCGEIKGMPSVKNGTLEIVNASGLSQSELIGKIALACTGDLSSADLAGWTVTVDGKAANLRPKLKGDVLGISPAGLAVILR